MNRVIRTLLAAACLVTLVSFAPRAARAATLPALPHAAASFDVGTLHVDRYGSGARSIVFIPGLASGPWSWAEAIAHFSSSYTVYALTLDGFDGRPYVPQSDPFASFATDFWKLLAQQHVTKPVVVGHSLGGTLAFSLAESHPERLAGIVALDGLPVFPTTAAMTPDHRAAMATALASKLASESHDDALAYETQFMQSVGTLDPTLVAPAAGLEASSDPRAIGAWAKADFGCDLRPQLAQVTIPALELMPYALPSPYTKAQTLAFYQMLLNGAPHASVAPIDGARHFAMLDQPAAVDDAITRFLSTAAW